MPCSDRIRLHGHGPAVGWDGKGATRFGARFPRKSGTMRRRVPSTCRMVHLARAACRTGAVAHSGNAGCATGDLRSSGGPGGIVEELGRGARGGHWPQRGRSGCRIHVRRPKSGRCRERHFPSQPVAADTCGARRHAGRRCPVQRGRGTG